MVPMPMNMSPRCPGTPKCMRASSRVTAEVTFGR
jgi:hypothetical protein